MIDKKHSFEIFGEAVNMASIDTKSTCQVPPPSNTPTLSVVILGLDAKITDIQPEAELKEKTFNHKLYAHVSESWRPSYIVRV